MHEIGNSSITNVKSLSHTRTHTPCPYTRAHTHTLGTLQMSMFVHVHLFWIVEYVCVCGCVFSSQLFFCFFSSLLNFAGIFNRSTLFLLSCSFSSTATQPSPKHIFNFNFLFTRKHNVSTAENMTTCTSWLFVSASCVCKRKRVWLYLISFGHRNTSLHLLFSHGIFFIIFFVASFSVHSPDLAVAFAIFSLESLLCFKHSKLPNYVFFLCLVFDAMHKHNLDAFLIEWKLRRNEKNNNSDMIDISMVYTIHMCMRLI